MRQVGRSGECFGNAPRRVRRIRVLKNTLAVERHHRATVAVSGFGSSTSVVRAGRALGRTTLLATGGAGQVFSETTNPAVATGDGVALAFRAGARIADMEFVQFHPTVLDAEGAPRFLLSEALRGEGAHLVDASGQPFMSRYHRSADLAPRDVVSRSIVLEAERTGGPIYLSLRHLDAGGGSSTVSDDCRRVSQGGIRPGPRSDSRRARPLIT